MYNCSYFNVLVTYSENLQYYCILYKSYLKSVQSIVHCLIQKTYKNTLTEWVRLQKIYWNANVLLAHVRCFFFLVAVDS